MSHYRVYFFDDAGHIRKAEEIECEDDATAIARIEQLNHPHAVELWQGARKVFRKQGD